MNVKRLLLLALSLLCAGGLLQVISIYADARTAAAPATGEATHANYLPLIALSAKMPANTPPPPTPDPNGAIVADHTVLGQFAQIPQNAINAAAARKSLFMHSQIGLRIDDLGLGCLAGLNDDPTNFPQECSTYANNRTAGAWPWYDNANLIWEFWAAPPPADAIAKTDQFVSVVNARAGNYDVLGMKFSFVDGWNQDVNVAQNYYINKMLALESQYPNKTFIWATSALWWDPGTSCNAMFNSCQFIAQFNQQVRAYARAHNKPLFDIAAIESHDRNGNPCTVTDAAGQPWEGMCDEWHGEHAGLPNAEGSIRLAKGFWWLMARISGWSGQ